MELGSRVESFGCGLRPGVVLFLGGVDAGPDRVQVSSGTVGAPAGTSAGVYESGAMIPRSDWRGLTVADRDVLIAESCPQFSGTAISVIRLPSELLDAFGSLRKAAFECRPREQVLALIGSGECVAGTEAIRAYLREHFLDANDNDDSLEGGVSAHLPKLPTVTANPKSGAFVGLHIDNFYSSPLDRRGYSPNRICINLGSEDRFLLYLNIPMAPIYGLMQNKRGAEKEFMRAFPSYPVVRLRVRPGEAYVAPTENMVHDGSSAEMAGMDLAFSVRGRLSLCPK